MTFFSNLFSLRVCFLAFLLGSFFSLNSYAEEESASKSAEKNIKQELLKKEALKKEQLKAAEGKLPLEDLRNFTQVFDQIRNAYVEEVDDPTLFKNAIIGMLSELDPHSAYLDKESFEELQTNTQGEFGGLGIEVGMEDGFIKVISPIDGTPAQRAGVKAGDLIIKLDSTPVKGMGLRKAIDKMRGKKGTPIVITVVREGENKSFEITIVRDMIKVVSVKVKKLGDEFVYARIAQFQIKTAENLKKLLVKIKKELKSESDKHINGLVLDLRNNPGGVLQGAVDVSDLFLENGLIVYTEGRIQNSNMRFEATAGDLLEGAPIAVLVNEGSASASEIVAGALQDHKRAIVLGTQSFGKGSVQTVLPLSENRAIKLTTARYYTPNGRSIQAEGIVPDIIVEYAVLERVKSEGRIKESDLDGHLDNKKSSKSSKNSGEENDISQWLEKDNQLHDALNVLKAMAMQSERAKERSQDLSEGLSNQAAVE